jgi:molybdopterin molybdotransferase
MVENTEADGNGRVRVLQPVRAGENIRARGEDIRSGDLLLEGGTRVRPLELALLAAQGITEIDVVMKPRVAILATGDELVDVSQPLSPGKIRNSNGPTIASVLTRWGNQVRDMGIGRDSPEELEETLRTVLPEVDALIMSGGVSVGDFDYTRRVLEKLGLTEVFWKVAIKPGKPLLFGIFQAGSGPWHRDITVFGLPGNPVSVLVCMEEFVRPALERMQGHVPRYPSYHLEGTVENEYVTPEERQQYLFCQVSEAGDGFRIHIIRPQGSAMMGMACRANALAISPVGTRKVEPGDRLSFRWIK